MSTSKIVKTKTKLSKVVVKNITTLKSYSSDIPRNQSLMNTVIHLYSTRDIRTLTTAISAMDLLKSNDINKFRTAFAKMTDKIPITMDKQRAKDKERQETQDAEIQVMVKKVDKTIHRPHIHTTHWETAAPSSKVVLKRDFKDFGDAWRASFKLLVKIVETHLTEKHNNLKVMLGVEYTVFKQSIDYEDQDPDEISMKQVSEPKIVFARTKAVSIYNIASVKPTILNLRTELEKKFLDGIDNQAGSNWTIGTIKNMFANTHTLKYLRGSSYLPTPERMDHPKCGLINPRNTDQRCFKYCMLYHQSPQLQNSHRITVLDKIEDKYNYGQLSYPTSLEDIRQFEEDNKITVNVFCLDSEKKL